MAIQTTSKFTRYAITPEEEISGNILTGAQKYVIQNERSSIAEQILSLKFDPLNSTDFAIQHSYLTGQLSVYDLLIDRSDECEKLMLQAARDQS